MSYFGSIYADQELSHRAKTVYMYLKDRSNADGTCWPSVRRIAEDLKLSRRTVQRALADLTHHGFLECTHRRRPNGSLTSSLYRIQIGRKKRTSRQGGSALEGCHKGSAIMAHPEGLTLSEGIKTEKEQTIAPMIRIFRPGEA